MPLAAALLGLSYLPYAYLGPSWSSHRHLLSSLGECLCDTVADVLIGYDYLRPGKNLLASAAMRTFFDDLQAVTAVHFGIAIHFGCAGRRPSDAG